MKIQKFQDGGAMAPEAAAPQEMAAPAEAQANPAEQILAAAAQAVQNQDGEMALQVCQAIVEMAQQGEQPQEEPQYYRKGGRLYRIK